MATTKHYTVLDNPVYNESYYRSTAALPTRALATTRFPPASPTEEREQWEERLIPSLLRRIRWADVKPTVIIAFVLVFLYIAFHSTNHLLIALGWGFGMGALALGLMPKKRTPVYTRLYMMRIFGQTFLVRGEEDDAWFAKGRR